MTSTAPSDYAQRVHSFARSVSCRLLLWSGLSMISGAALWWRGNAFWRAFGIQAVVWGAIDALIAGAGLVGGRRQADRLLPVTAAPAAKMLPMGAGAQAAPVEDSALDTTVLDPAVDAAVDAARSARRLSRLLWFNALLDVGYMAGGAWLVRTKGRTDPAWRGHGWGIVVQGAFLFVFDLAHALRVPTKETHP
jgi:hypothetical protein